MPKAAISEIRLRALTSQPLNDWVLVKMIEEKDGDVVIPDSAKERSTIASVVAVGPLVAELKTGDRVLISRYGMDVKVDGEDLVLVKSAEVYLRFPDGSAN